MNRLFLLGLLGMSFISFAGKSIPPAKSVFLVAGQSNAVGQGVSGSFAGELTLALEYKYGSNAFVALKDPVGEDLLDLEMARAGSAWPAFAEQFCKDGRELILIPAARGGSSCDARAELMPYGTWAEAGKLFNRAVLKTNAALALSKTTLSGIIWCQGERDANAINEGKLTARQYEESLKNLIVRFQHIYRSDLPFYIIQTGYYKGHPKRGFDAVRKAQVNVAASVAHVHVVYGDTHLFKDADLLPDGIHYNQQSLNKIGKDVATIVKRAMDERLSLAKIFTDHLVFQEGREIAIWGRAASGSEVTLNFNKVTVKAVAAADGKWVAKFPPMHYGGPYVLKTKSGKQEMAIKDVMIGEVWLASGQSNMHFQVGYPVANIKEVLADSELPMIREFGVPLTVRNRPADEVQGEGWKVCNPTNVLQFSAVAFFFAKQIHKHKNVAVGIIHASYGGTLIEAWLPQQKGNEEDWEALQALSDSIDIVRKSVIDTAAQGIRVGVQAVSYDDSSWNKAKYPVMTTAIAPPYGFVWFRKTIELPTLTKKTDFKLKLGKLAESDITYFNGIEVGRGKQQDSTIYVVPAKLIRRGKNVIAIRLVSQWGNGRLGFPADSAFLENADQSLKVLLHGEWAYNTTIEPVLQKGNGYQNQPSSLFNGMIYPLTPYGIKGFLWYQGESNALNYRQYGAQQSELIKSWRRQWRLGDLPFIFVQLPGLKGMTSLPMMREAQASSLKELNTGMVVSFDAGDSYDIHPHKKQPIGLRLGLQALGMVYDKSIVKDGPVYRSYRVEGTSVRLEFEDSSSPVVLRQTAKTAFMVAGEDHQFYPADARIENAGIVVQSRFVPRPVAVRYAWDAEPEVSLYNEAGIPAAPFRTDKWQN